MKDNPKHIQLHLTIEGTTYDLEVGGLPPDIDTDKLSMVHTDQSFKTRDLLIDHIATLVPKAPGYTTIEELREQVQGISYATVRRILLRLVEAGVVRSTHPRSQRRGSTAIRWMR